MIRELEMVLGIRKPGTTASFLHRQLNQVACPEEAAFQRKITGDLKVVTVISSMKSFCDPLRLVPLSVSWERITRRTSTLFGRPGAASPLLKARVAGKRHESMGSARL